MTEVIYLKVNKETPPINIERPKEKYDEACRKFHKWLSVGAPGEKYCYYLGEHVCGQLVGRAAYRAYEDGFITLFQTRQGKFFAYWAQKKRRWE